MTPAHAFDARQSHVVQYGDPTGPLDTQGHSVGVLHPVAIQGSLINCGEGGPNGVGVSDDGVMYTLTGRHVHGVALDVAHTLDQAQGQAVALPAMAVRRLTPRECERLQGFPDDYTLISYRGKPAADGPRYKALGNSMAVPVMRWIGQRLQAVDGMTE